jgi:CheY-like chemotaxis protein
MSRSVTRHMSSLRLGTSSSNKSKIFNRSDTIQENFRVNYDNFKSLLSRTQGQNSTEICQTIESQTPSNSSQKHDESFEFTPSMKRNVSLFKKIKNEGKILLVDDNQYIRTSVKNLVKSVLSENKKYYEYLEGSDGVEILNYIIQDQMENNMIKCIITDENMEYINGSEAIRIIRELQKTNKIKNVKIISITSFEDEITKKNILDSGVDFLLPKPCTKKAFSDIFKKIGMI